MSNNFKPLPEQIAEKMISDLKAGTSIFQKPAKQDGTSQFTQPFNPSTGNRYKGPSALILLMKNREDPRWMTLKQASYNKSPVEKGEKGTLINFFKTSDIQPVLNDKGEQELKENGKPKTQVVKLEEAVLTDAWMFNGEQLKNMPEWNAGQQLTPGERLNNIVETSKMSLLHSGSEIFYEPVADKIQMSAKSNFESDEKYNVALLKEMAHWAGHENRLNKPADGKPGSDLPAKEALRTEIASILLSAELNIGYDIGKEHQFVDAWAGILKNDPKELFKAASDAQKISDHILSFEQKPELKQDLSEARSNPDKLSKGEVIAYNGKQYTILAELKHKVLQIVDDTGAKTKISPKNGIYASLLNARDNPLDKGFNLEVAIPEEAMSEKENTAHSMKR